MNRFLLFVIVAVSAVGAIWAAAVVISHLLPSEESAKAEPALDPAIGRDQWRQHQQERLRRQQEITTRAGATDMDVSRKAHPQPPPVSRREEERRASARLSRGF